MSNIPRYFLYLSDAKVSMLYEQIERPSKNIKTAFQVVPGNGLELKYLPNFRCQKTTFTKGLKKCING